MMADAENMTEYCADRDRDKKIAMVRDFVLRASGENREMADIFDRLLDEETAGGVCMKLTDADINVLRGKEPLVSFAPDISGFFIVSEDSKLLYTRRNWCYEDLVRQRITAMASIKYDELAIPVDGAFENLNQKQRDAISIISSRQFSIMSGGPGTGKTYTVARAVKLICDRNPGIRIGLAAPTGKAAARVNEAMQSEAEKLQIGKISAVTLNSLLCANRDFVTFKHNRDNPLELDWLIIDEASMIPLSMMAKILDALPENCRLTLVGDANQLSSVEAGCVFGDLCNMKVVENQCKCELHESKRFPPDGEIAKLADCINRGDAESALALLENSDNEKIHFIESGPTDVPENFFVTVQQLFSNFCRQKSAEEALKALGDCRILCAFRNSGNFGCEVINDRVRRKLQTEYPGCPLPFMITKNDHALGVSNGDVGVVMNSGNALLSSKDQVLSLPQSDSTIRNIPLSLLPDREMAFASTIHKAQGSEFENIILVLPEVTPEVKAYSLLTRELLYTALTRTGYGEIFIYAGKDAIRQCCEKKTERRSGLS